MPSPWLSSGRPPTPSSRNGTSGTDELLGEAREDGGELRRVVGSVVGRHHHPGQQHATAGIARARDDATQIALGLLERQPAQAVVGPERHHHHGGMLRQQPLEAAQATGAGVAAHAGVEQPHRVTGGGELPRDQSRVRLVFVHAQAGGQAVAEENDQRVARAGGSSTSRRGQVFTGLRQHGGSEAHQQQRQEESRSHLVIVAAGAPRPGC